MPIVAADLHEEEHSRQWDLRQTILDFVTRATDCSTQDRWLIPLALARDPELVAVVSMEAARQEEASLHTNRPMTAEEEFRLVLETSRRSHNVTWYTLPETINGKTLQQTCELYLGGDSRLYLLESTDIDLDYNLVVLNQEGQCYIILENRSSGNLETIGFAGAITTEVDAHQIPVLTHLRNHTRLQDSFVAQLRIGILARMELVLDMGLTDSGADAVLLSATLTHKIDSEMPNPLEVTLPIRTVKPLCVRLMPGGEKRFLGFKPDSSLELNLYEFESPQSHLNLVLLEPPTAPIEGMGDLTTSKFLHLVQRSQIVYTVESPKLVPDSLVDRGSLAADHTYLRGTGNNEAILSYVLQQEGEVKRIYILSDNEGISTYVGQVLNDAIIRKDFDIRILSDGLIARGLKGQFLILVEVQETFYKKEDVSVSFPRLVLMDPGIDSLAQGGVLARLLRPEDGIVRVGDLIPLIMDMQPVSVQQPIHQSLRI